MWSGIKAELVKHLPEGVDRLRVFKIPSESLKNEGKIFLKTGETGKKLPNRMERPPSCQVCRLQRI